MEPEIDQTPREEMPENNPGEVSVGDAPENASSDADEEDECRVCRGPAEEG